MQGKNSSPIKVLLETVNPKDGEVVFLSAEGITEADLHELCKQANKAGISMLVGVNYRLKITKVRPKDGAVLFLSADGIPEADLNGLRDQTEKMGLDAIAVNYPLKVKSVAAKGVRQISVYCTKSLKAADKRDLLKVTAKHVKNAQRKAP